MSTRIVVAIIAVVVVLVVASASLFTVGQEQRALVLQFGQITRVDVPPGLHFKIPLVQQVALFDDRLLTLEGEPAELTTADKKTLRVDYFVKWEIDDAASFYRTAGGEPERAVERLTQVVKDGLRRAFATRTLAQVVSGDRTEIAETIESTAGEAVADMGLNVVDMRIKGIELPENLAEMVYQRMRTQRERLAAQLRAEGERVASNIRSEAERKHAAILSEAYAESQRIRGEGDAGAAAIYAEAYNQDPEFYRFRRSLQVYESGWNDPGDVLVLDPDSPLLRYFRPPTPSG